MCAQLCPDRVSRLFDDVSTSVKLQKAVSAVAIDWRQNSAVDLWIVCHSAILNISFQLSPLTVQKYDCTMSELNKIDPHLCVYFTAVAFLHVAYESTRHYFVSDKLADVLMTILGQFVGKRRYSRHFCSVLSLMSQATKLMKVVANSPRCTVQLIEIELSKAYLFTALSGEGSDSIYCLANVYLAVLYYTTGQYQRSMDHCTLTRSVAEQFACCTRRPVTKT